jgi:hypothetical protein
VTLKNSSKTGFEEAAGSCDGTGLACVSVTRTPIERQKTQKSP